MYRKRGEIEIELYWEERGVLGSENDNYLGEKYEF
jgi:hypothetical protein